MMDYLRNKTHVVLFTLIGAFLGLIVFEWGANVTGITNRDGNLVGKIEEQEIDFRFFQAQIDNRLTEERNKNSNQELSIEQRETVVKDEWKKLIQQLVVQKEVDKRKFSVSDDRLVYEFENNPPDILKQQAVFQDSVTGQFDLAKFKQIVAGAGDNPQISNYLKGIEGIVRSNTPFQDIQSLVRASARVSHEEIMEEFAGQNKKAKVALISYVRVNLPAMEYEPTNEEMRAYYDSHLDDYNKKESREIEYVFFEEKPGDIDKNYALNDAKDVIRKLSEGYEFADLAKEYSEDTSNKDKGGDLGFFGKGRMVKPFEDAVFNAKPGDVVGPVETQFGYHVIKVESFREVDAKDGKGKDKEAKARHILIKVSTGPETIEVVDSQANTFARMVAEEGIDFTEAADSLKTKVSKFDNILEDTKFISGLGNSVPTVRFALKASSGQVTNKPIRFSTPNKKGWIVARLVKIVPEHVQDFEKVQSQVQNALIQANQMDRTKEVIDKVYARIQEGKSLVDAADTLKVDTVDVALLGSIPNVGKNLELNGKIHTLKVGDIIPPYELENRGYVIAQLVEEAKLDTTGIARRKDIISNRLKRVKESNTIVNWLEKLEENAQVVDNRDKFYPDYDLSSEDS
ncbi:MAG: hypothetical protein DWQ06_15060 [Calditrichaeota bacterium]|nr:MAG: hypothetical protein DWQ06_15060 [Calditrichota bacterium]